MKIIFNKPKQVFKNLFLSNIPFLKRFIWITLHDACWSNRLHHIRVEIFLLTWMLFNFKIPRKILFV